MRSSEQHKIVGTGKSKRAAERRGPSVLTILLLLITVQPASGRTVAEAQFGDLYEKASAAIHKSEIEKALGWAEQSLLVARRMGDKLKEAQALDLIGNAYFYLGRYTDALDYFQSALLILRGAADQYSLANVLKDIGITYTRLGRFDEAFEPLYEALDIFRRLGASSSAQSALENLGMNYAAVGAYNPAFEICTQALEIARETHNPQLIFGALIRIGVLHHNLNSDERAFDYLRQALAIAEQQKLSPMDRAWAMQELSIALGKLGQTDAAIEMRRGSLTICEQIGWKMGKADNYQGLGELYLDRDPALALVYFQRARTIFERVDYNLRSDLYASMALAYRRLDDLDRAIEHYEQAIEHLESVRDQLFFEQHRATLLGKHQRVYQELVETLIERYKRNPDNRDDIRAFAIYERGKAGALLEAIVEARLDIERDLDPSLRRKQEQLNARITELRKHLIASDVAKSERRQMLDRLNQAEEEFDQLVADIKRQNPRYAMLRYPRRLSLEQAQASLGDKTAMLAYSITEDHVFAFLLTARSFIAERLTVSPQVLRARVQNYVDILARGDEAGWQEASARLYAELVAPLRRHLPPQVSRLVIVPDGRLHYLPFETLRLSRKNTQESDGQAHFLLEEFAISYAPSATVLAELGATEQSLLASERADLLIVADPAIDKDRGSPVGLHSAADYARLLYDDEGLEVTPIPFAGSEAREVERYAGPGSKVYIGTEASERTIKAGKLDSFRVIHFATHAFISLRKPERSALVLASSQGDGEDGFLQAREIYHLKLASDLLVLSACETARGRILAGEGAQGLAQAFFYAGAQSVVASLWKVDDEEAATFMRAFYHNLAEAKSKDEALRAVKLEMMRNGSTASPRHWASFILIGEAAKSVPISDRPRRLPYDRWLAASALVVLICLIAFVVLRRRVS